MIERCEAGRMHRANEVDQRMAALVKQKNRVMAEMIPLVHEIERDRLFSVLGETSVTNYMRRRARWEKSKTEKVVALARKLVHLPHLREALARGDVAWTTAYIAALAAEPETDAEWTQKALTLTNEQLEAERARVAGREVVERVTLGVSPSQLAAIDQAVSAVRGESTKDLSFAEAVTEACKRAVEGGSVGGSNHRVVINYCPGCHKATRDGKNGPVEISQAELETVACDSELLDIRRGEKAVSRTIPPKVSNFVQARDHGRCRVPRCQNRAHVNLHHQGGWRSVGHNPDSIYICCVAHHHAIHDGDLVVRTLAPGRFEFLRRDGVSLGTVDLSVPLEVPGAVTFRTEGPLGDTFRTEGRSGETVDAEGPGAGTFRTEVSPGDKGPLGDTFRTEGPEADTFRTEGSPGDTSHAEAHVRSDLATEAAFAVAALRKLEFREGVARELVTRAIRSTPLEHGTAEEILGAALRLVDSPFCAR